MTASIFHHQPESITKGTKAVETVGSFRVTLRPWWLEKRFGSPEKAGYDARFSMICSHCSTTMPEISAFCPGCGRSVQSEESHGAAPMDAVAPLSGDGFVAALAYIAVFPAIVILLVPALKRRTFVRFHAWQSILFTVAVVCIGIVARLVFAALLPLLAWLVAGLVALAIVFLWLVLLVKAVSGDAYQLSWIGHIAARLSESE